MANDPQIRENDQKNRLKWLIFFRLLFSTLLLGSTIFFQLGESPSPVSRPLLVLYGLIITIFVLTFIYAAMLKREVFGQRTVTVQIILDTFMVTVIISVTGGFTSIFNFLYLVVIIYASILLSRRSTAVIAALCCIQFGIMVDLEYFGWLNPFQRLDSQLASAHEWHEVLYKILITMVACFLVALLSSFLSEQTRRSRRELSAMANHVKRVEKMAAIGELAAGLAHEIKNPLASLSGAIQLLKEDMRYDPDHDRLMHIILREADRLSSLTTNFLLFARPPTGKNQPIELEKAIKEATELFKKDVDGQRTIETRTVLETGLWIEMDPAHLKQILWNLLLNAAESIETAGQISIRTFSTKNKHATMCIRDNGCGMPPDTLQSIFDPFYTTKATGTGLGLSIVQRILDHYDAWLNVSSKPGEGTEFTIKFKQAPQG
jgi:two-component system sensor histidine kinase PilS (NtrC family)